MSFIAIAFDSMSIYPSYYMISDFGISNGSVSKLSQKADSPKQFFRHGHLEARTLALGLLSAIELY